MSDARQPTEEERERDIYFLTHILTEIRDYIIYCGHEPDDTLKAATGLIFALLKPEDER